MGSKRPARREFLRAAPRWPVGSPWEPRRPRSAPGTSLARNAPPPPMIKGDKDGEIAYGARSKYVTSVRIPHGGRPSPDQLRAHVSCRDPASGFGRGDHAVLAPLLGDDAWRLPAGHRSQRALV